MKFIEMTGADLLEVVDREVEGQAEQFRALGLKEDSLVRVNPQGDVEIRRPDRWDILGGLLGDFKERVRRQTGRDFA